MDSKSGSLVAAVAGLVLMCPAGIFMAALVVRMLPQLEIARAAQALVMWYSARMWTLWLLLMALPMVALLTGCAVLARGFRPRFPIAMTTMASAVILAIVILHMAAN